MVSKPVTIKFVVHVRKVLIKCLNEKKSFRLNYFSTNVYGLNQYSNRSKCYRFKIVRSLNGIDNKYII